MCYPDIGTGGKKLWSVAQATLAETERHYSTVEKDGLGHYSVATMAQPLWHGHYGMKCNSAVILGCRDTMARDVLKIRGVLKRKVFVHENKVAINSTVIVENRW